MNQSPQTPTQVQIQTNPPSNLHEYAAFIERGLSDIRRKVSAIDWMPFDVLGAIRGGQAECVIVSRGTKALGFVVWYRQARPWSGKLDLFVWAAWAIPLREREAGDNVSEAVLLTVQWLKEQKRLIGANKIVFISSRKGFARRFGFKPVLMTFWDRE